MNANYSEIGGPDGKLARLEPFNGNSMSARGDVDGNGYCVFSYATMIARVDRAPDDGKFVASVTTGGFSPTTSRQQNLCRAWLPGAHVDVAAPSMGGDLAPFDGEAR